MGGGATGTTGATQGNFFKDFLTGMATGAGGVPSGGGTMGTSGGSGGGFGQFMTDFIEGAAVPYGHNPYARQRANLQQQRFQLEQQVTQRKMQAAEQQKKEDEAAHSALSTAKMLERAYSKLQKQGKTKAANRALMESKRFYDTAASYGRKDALIKAETIGQMTTQKPSEKSIGKAETEAGKYYNLAERLKLRGNDTASKKALEKANSLINDSSTEWQNSKLKDLDTLQQMEETGKISKESADQFRAYLYGDRFTKANIGDETAIIDKATGKITKRLGNVKVAKKGEAPKKPGYYSGKSIEAQTMNSIIDSGYTEAYVDVPKDDPTYMSKRMVVAKRMYEEMMSEKPSQQIAQDILRGLITSNLLDVDEASEKANQLVDYINNVKGGTLPKLKKYDTREDQTNEERKSTMIREVYKLMTDNGWTFNRAYEYYRKAKMTR